MTDSGLWPCCAACGEPIGVYERALSVVDGHVLDSSHRQRQEPAAADGAHYHCTCFPGRHGVPRA